MAKTPNASWAALQPYDRAEWPALQREPDADLQPPTIIEHTQTIVTGGGGFEGFRTYTPDWTATTTDPAIGNGTLDGYYQVSGQLLVLHVYMKAGSTTTFGSGEWRFGFPDGLTALIAQAGPATAHDSGTTILNASCLSNFASGSTGNPAIVVVRNNQFNSTNPFTWATNDELAFSAIWQLD